MKYLGLQASLRNDSKIEKLLAKHGGAGFSFYVWMILAAADKTTPKAPWGEVDIDFEVTGAKLKIQSNDLNSILDDILKWELVHLWDNRYFCPRVILYSDKAFRNDVSNPDEVSDDLIAAFRSQKGAKIPLAIEVTATSAKQGARRCHLVPLGATLNKSEENPLKQHEVPQSATMCHNVPQCGPKEEKRREEERSLNQPKEVKTKGGEDASTHPQTIDTPLGSFNINPDPERLKIANKIEDLYQTLENPRLPDRVRQEIKDEINTLENSI